MTLCARIGIAILLRIMLSIYSCLGSFDRRSLTYLSFIRSLLTSQFSDDLFKTYYFLKILNLWLCSFPCMRFSLGNRFDIFILGFLLIWWFWKLVNLLLLSVLCYIQIRPSSILSSCDKSCITTKSLVLLVSLNSGPLVLSDFVRLWYLSLLVVLLNSLILLSSELMV